MTRSVSNDRGFTLAELMVVLFLAAVAAVIAERFMGNWYKAYEFGGFVRAIDTALMTARARAIAVRRPVRLILTEWCPSEWDNSSNCVEIREPGSSDYLLKNDTRVTCEAWNEDDDPNTSDDERDFYRLVLLWAKKQWKGVTPYKPYYEIEVTSTADPRDLDDAADPSSDTRQNQIWFDPRGFAIASRKDPTKTQFEVKVKGNAAKRVQTFIVTPLGKVRIKRETVE